ncbi:MAG: phosphatase PAP2 family protein [Cyanobacteriota bacterium]|nr:phosphatase PAP2 family protein [Cyanobacteriota bacterium]
MLPIDGALLRGIERLSTPPLRAAMVTLYRLTGKGTMPLLVLTTLAVLARQRRWTDLVLVAGACGGVYVWVDLLLKPLVNRARPVDPLLMLDSSSFPSGHTAGAVAFSLSLALVLMRSWPRQRQLLLLLSGIWSTVVGFSTLVVRAHWPSDVIGGAAVGLVWLELCLAVWRQGLHRTRHR